MLKALLFDVDGTLAETEERHRLAFNQAFMLEGLDWYWDRALYARLLKVTGGKERLRAFIDEAAPERRAAATALAARLHALKTRLYTRAIADGAAPLRPGVLALMEEARAAGLILSLVTTTTLANVDALLSVALGAQWRTMFPVVVAGDMAAAKKPAPDAYRQAVEALRLDPCETLAIEDSENGVRAACGAGVPVVAVRSVYSARDDLSAAAAIFERSEDLSLAALRAAHGEEASARRGRA